MVREEAYQMVAKTIRLITAFMLLGPGKGPPHPTYRRTIMILMPSLGSTIPMG
jgi:hypothetical protein